MEKAAVRKAIKAQRLNKKVTIAEVAKTVGKNPTFVAAALNGNHRLSPEEAGKVGKLLDLDKEQISSLSAFPVRADFPNATVEPAIKPQMTAPFRMLFGLANDEIGYIIPKSEWDEKAPWLQNAPKRWYGEVNSIGPEAAPMIAAAFAALLRQ